MEMLNARPLITAEPNFNVSPSQPIIIIFLMNGERSLLQVRWGLIPHWSKEPKSKYMTHNAVSERVASANTYRYAYKKNQRCLIPVDGFYEWKAGTPKQPYFIHRSDNQPFTFAGLWDRWEGEETHIESCVILTTTANKFMDAIHDRMPVVVEIYRHAQWLDPAQDSKGMSGLLAPREYEGFEAYPISTAVNKPSNKGPNLIERISL